MQAVSQKLKGLSPEIDFRSSLADAFMMAEGNFVGSAKQVSSNTPGSETIACITWLWYGNLGGPVISTLREWWAKLKVRLFDICRKSDNCIVPRKRVIPAEGRRLHKSNPKGETCTTLRSRLCMVIATGGDSDLTSCECLSAEPYA